MSTLSRQQPHHLHKTKIIAAKIVNMQEFVQNNSGSFSQEVIALCKRRGYNKITFCTKTLLSERTYDRIMHQEIQGMPRPETVMRICIGLDLGIEYGEPLFEKAGYNLGGSKLLLAYRTILIECKKINIYECNEILEALDLPILASHMIRSLK